MNVLIVLDALGTGGTERQMEALLRHWPKDDGVQVCALAKGGDAIARYERVTRVHFLERRGKLDLRQALPLRDLVHHLDADVVLAGHRYAGLVSKLSTLRGLEVPVVCSVRGWHPYSPIQKLVYEVVDLALMRRAAAVVVNSELVAEGLRARSLFTGEVTVIPNGVEPSGATLSREAARAAYGIPAGASLIIAVGRLVEVKDPLAAIAALDVVHNAGHDAHLLWAGEGPLRSVVETEVRRRGLEFVTHLPGTVEKPADALAAADLLLHTSRWENMSNTILEAMVAGLPVVARDVGGNRELVADGRTGRLGEDLAAYVLELLGDPTQARAMGERGRSRAHDAFSMATAVDSYRRLFARVVNGVAPEEQS